MTFSHFFVDDILAGNLLLSIPSLTQFPSGDDMFRIILTEPFGFGRHIIPLTFAASGTSSDATGPYTNPLLTQLATASVT